MAQVLIRNLEDETVARLKGRAELAGKSLEQFLRDLLSEAAPLSADEKVAASRRLRAAFASEDWDAAAVVRWGRDDEFYEIEQKFDSKSALWWMRVSLSTGRSTRLTPPSRSDYSEAVFR